MPTCALTSPKRTRDSDEVAFTIATSTSSRKASYCDSMLGAYTCKIHRDCFCSLSSKIKIKIKSSLYSLEYAEACNEWRGPSPRLSAWATQLRRNVAAVASRWRHCADLTGSGIEPQTSRTESVRLATELTAGRQKPFLPVVPSQQHTQLCWGSQLSQHQLEQALLHQHLNRKFSTHHSTRQFQNPGALMMKFSQQGDTVGLRKQAPALFLSVTKRSSSQ